MADRIQQRRDTKARWEEFNPVLLEGEVGYVTDDPNLYKIGDGINAWNDLPYRGFDGTIVHETGDSESVVMSQKAVTEKLSELDSKQGAYSGYCIAHKSKCYNIASGASTGSFVSAENFDCVIIRVLDGSSKIEVTGAQPYIFVFFDSLNITENYLSVNSTGNIPEGARLCVIDFKKTDNTAGYDDMRIRQEGGGVDTVEFEEAKSLLTSEDERLSFIQSFALNSILARSAVEEETVSYEIMEDKFFSDVALTLKDNTNYDCWKADVSSLRGSVLHVVCSLYGDLSAISFIDEEEKHISTHFSQSEIGSSSNTSLYVVVPKTAAYILVNTNTNYVGENPGIWKVTRFSQFDKDIKPTFEAAIDALSVEGKMLVVPNACAVVSNGNPTHGNIVWNTTGFHMGIYKLRSKEPIVLVGESASIFMYYNSINFSNETLVGYNPTEIPEDAKYCVIDFNSSIDIERIKETRINQTNTFSFHEKALRNTKQVLIERDYSKDAELFNHGLLLDGTIVETESAYGVSIFNIDDSHKYNRILFTGALYGPADYASFAFYDEDDVFISSEKKHTSTRATINLLELDVPENVSKIAILYQGGTRIPTLYGELKEDYISTNSIKENINAVKEQCSKIVDTIVPVLTAGNNGLWNVGGFSGNSSFRYNEYLVSDINQIDGEHLLFKAGITADTTIHFIVFFDEEGIILGGQHVYDTPIIVDGDLEITIPEGTYKVVVNSNYKYPITLFKRKYESYDSDIAELQTALEKSSELSEVEMTEKKEGYFISAGVEKANSAFHIDTYSIEGLDADYLYVSGGIGSNTELSIANYYNGDVYLGRDLYYSEPTVLVSEKIVPPEGTTIVKLVSSNSYTTRLEYSKTEGFYKIEELDNRIKSVEESLDNGKLMKVNIYALEPSLEGRLFSLRTRYNSSKDIVLMYYVNNNSLISPYAAYIGDNALSDSAIIASANRMSAHSDSTAPLFNSSVYWHLFAQHGYLVPRINNTVGFTSDDVGAVWKDQLSREYTIGNVTDSLVTLLPTIYKDENGNDTRGWKTPNSTAITTLTHVSGGVYTTEFTTDNASSVQLRPIMNHSNRVFMVDGKEVTESGTYYCDEFKVSESQVGFDPSSISNWFPLPVLDAAKEMARFTWSYNFKGAQCCVNTTIDIRTRVECQSYGATQQQTFLDNGDYKAMFVIPKAAARNGVELDKPFNSPATSSPNYMFYRTSEYLKDVDDPIDRLIGFLYNPTDNSYLFGMAAGLSLVSGDTVKEKRVADMPLGDTNSHYRVGSLSPSNTNKFYVAAINTAPYEADNYHFPTTLFKEINYYLCFFDPAENEGQVYWYKDGSKYVIYMHCQSEQNKLAVNLPDFMEGLKVEIVEKTEGAKLLTDVIQNGKLYINYTNEANYIVVQTT